MTNTKRWLDELPLESQERELLLVGKSARPAAGAIDANWRAICAGLGTTAGVSGVASSAAANTVSASAKVGTSMIVSKAAGTGLVVAAAKSLAVGAVIGLALMGASTVVERSFAPRTPSTSLSNPRATSTARRAIPQPMSTTMAAPTDHASSVATTTSSSQTSPSPARERVALSANAPATAPPSSAMTPEARRASLAQQARELAELKRLIDSGGASEALRRLNDHFNAGTTSLLTEERDALYVQALARAQRRSEAQARARQFLVRYPHSPYSETMRQLLAEK